jgi:UDP-N-acetylglucosamine 2-epimerase (non-hydrolysing)/UDP-GlcNAc3NAcA epimerase
VFPVHPRTRVRLEATGRLSQLEVDGVHLSPPVGYLELLALAMHARAVVTDSGGLQKEAYLVEVPCVTLRDTTEWVETVESGWNVLVDLDAEAAVAALDRPRPADHPDLYGGGLAGERIRDAIDAFAGARPASRPRG